MSSSEIRTSSGGVDCHQSNRNTATAAPTEENEAISHQVEQMSLKADGGAIQTSDVRAGNAAVLGRGDDEANDSGLLDNGDTECTVDGIFGKKKDVPDSTKIQGKVVEEFIAVPSPMCKYGSNGLKHSMCVPQCYADGPGLAVIIGNENFKCTRHGLNKLAGTKKDVQRLVKTFRDTLGISDIFVKNDATQKDINDVIQEVLDKVNVKNYGYLIFVIVTHGSEGEVIYTADECTKATPKKCNDVKQRCFKKDVPVCTDPDHYEQCQMKLLEVIEPLKKCNELIGKPKWFIVQVCRGINPDLGQVKTKGDDDQPADPWVGVTTPVEADVMMTYACPVGYYALQTEMSGSCMIKNLCECLVWLKAEQQEGSRVEIQRLMVELNALGSKEKVLVWDKNKNKYVEAVIMPCITHTMTREFYLLPMTSLPAGDQ